MRNHTIEILSRKMLRLSVFAILLVFGVSSCTRNVYVVKKNASRACQKNNGFKICETLRSRAGEKEGEKVLRVFRLFTITKDSMDSNMW